MLDEGKKEFWRKKKKKKWESKRKSGKLVREKNSGKKYSDVLKNVVIRKINAAKTQFSVTFQETSLLICDIATFCRKRRNRVTI